MSKPNLHYLKLKKNYLFAEIEKRVLKFRKKHPELELFNLGIGDTILPISKIILDEIILATKELGDIDTFKGYGPSEGYDFLREKIKKVDYKDLGIESDEIFISNGTKSDIANIQELFSNEIKIAIPDPAYPVYEDSNVLAGRSKGLLKNYQFENFTYYSYLEDFGFSPTIPNEKCDLIYICSPHNPTGYAMTKDELKKWIDYAKDINAIILFDAAYTAFARSKNIPKTIYEIEGAKDVVVEFKSFSKSCAFTNLRASYVVIPKSIKLNHPDKDILLHSLWARRHSTKFGGIPYPIQKGILKFYEKDGLLNIQKNIDYYLENAKLLKNIFEEIGFKVFGGENSPYLWCRYKNLSSFEIFDKLLKDFQIISIPGEGFGVSGKNFVRLSSFVKKENVVKINNRICKNNLTEVV